MALAGAKSEDVATRKGALLVALALPMSHGHPILWDLVIDPVPEIRQQVFERAQTAQHDGLQLLRRAAESADHGMATIAVQHLTAALDHPSLPIMRRLLNHDIAEIRSRAATFLGWTAGPGVRPKLQSLVSSDAEASVREAAQAALDVIGDPTDRPEPVWWWETQRPVKASKKKTTPAPKKAAEKRPAKEKPAANNQEDPPSVADIVRAAGGTEPKDDGPWTALDAAALQEVGRLLASTRPDDDPTLCVGLARCVARYARPHWTVHLRPLLSAGDPALRAHAVAGLAAVAGPSQVPWFRPLLGDDQPDVRLAAIEAFATLCERLERSDLLGGYLTPLTHDSDGAVQQAALAALAS
jgi:HEAT repeat protein